MQKAGDGDHLIQISRGLPAPRRRSKTTSEKGCLVSAPRGMPLQDRSRAPAASDDCSVTLSSNFTNPRAGARVLGLGLGLGRSQQKKDSTVQTTAGTCTTADRSASWVLYLS